MLSLAKVFRHLIRTGTVTFVDAGGKVHRIAKGIPGPELTLRQHDRRRHRLLILDPDLGAGEAPLARGNTAPLGLLKKSAHPDSMAMSRRASPCWVKRTAVSLSCS